MASFQVLIVDDSLVFRSQIKAALSNVPGITVVGVASNGKIALQKLSQLKVDLMTLDLEMGEMNGLETLAEMKKQGLTTKVIIFSSKTRVGADNAILALQAGAIDIVTKPDGEVATLETALQDIQRELVPKIKQFLPEETKEKIEPLVKATMPTLSNTYQNVLEAKKEFSYRKINVDIFKPSVIVIGSSTGGPDALDRIFQQFSYPIGIPILITQHMPPLFITSLAKRIQTVSGVTCTEGRQWELIESNRIYIAPGDYHMTVTNIEGQNRIRLHQGPKVQSVRPAVDLLFQSAAKVYGASCMGYVLTGMGEDGLQGSHAIKQAGGGIMIQEAQSCVVFGMPGAIFKAGIHDKIGDLAAIKRLIENQAKEIAKPLAINRAS